MKDKLNKILGDVKKIENNILELLKEIKKKEVLELKYEKIDDNYTAAIITYQDYDILKRSEFEDWKLGIFSCDYSDYGYINKSIYIQGTNTKKDNRPMLIPNDELDEFKERIKKLNNKYGKEEK